MGPLEILLPLRLAAMLASLVSIRDVVRVVRVDKRVFGA